MPRGAGPGHGRACATRFGPDARFGGAAGAARRTTTGVDLDGRARRDRRATHAASGAHATATANAASSRKRRRSSLA